MVTQPQEKISYGTLLVVAGIGSVNIVPQRILTHVLHVPKLFVSLVSVQGLAKLDEYRIIIDDIDVLWYNKVHGWKIRLAKVHHGVYYLPRTP